VETKQIGSGNPNAILMRQTCGQRSNMVTVSERQTIEFVFPYEFAVGS